MSARVTLSTGSLYGYSLERIVAMAARLDVDGLEVLLTDDLVRTGPAALARLSQRYDLPVLSVHFPFMGRTSDQDVHDAYERTAAFATALPNCEAVVVHTSLATSVHSPAGQHYLQAVRRCYQTLRGSRAQLSIENRGVASVPPRPAYLDDLVNLRRLAEEWDLTLTYDIGHAASWGLEIVQGFETLGPRVNNIHLSNTHARPWFFSLPRIHSHLRDHQPVGSGILPIPALLHHLLTGGYRGLVTLEISPIALHLPLPWGVLDRLRDSVQRTRAGLTADPGPDAGRRSPRRRRAPTDPV
jgi:sugar phosphate isomerase/epimerase